MTNYDLVLEQLQKYNENELFYKEYDTVKHSQEALRQFLSHYTPEEIIRRRLICPELFPEDRSFLSERLFFKIENNRNIWIEKHNRYSPVYLHQHEYFEAFFVLSGQCQHYIHDEKTTLRQGALCFIAPYVNHSVGVFDDSIVLNIMIQRTTFDDIFFNVLRSHNILSDFFLSNLYGHSRMTSLSFHLDDEELISLLLSMVLEETIEDSYTYRILNSIMSLFFTKLVRKYARSEATCTFTSELKDDGLRIVSYVNDHYRSVTLEDVAGHFHYSLAYCSRLIKSVTGKNFTQVLRRIRMRRAETLLLTTALSVENISNLIGYENAATFIALFKQEYGMTPGQYRQQA